MNTKSPFIYLGEKKYTMNDFDWCDRQWQIDDDRFWQVHAASLHGSSAPSYYQAFSDVENMVTWCYENLNTSGCASVEWKCVVCKVLINGKLGERFTITHLDDLDGFKRSRLWFIKNYDLLLISIKVDDPDDKMLFRLTWCDSLAESSYPKTNKIHNIIMVSL